MEKLIAVFKEMLESETVDEVGKLLTKHGIDRKFHFPDSTYPRLDFRVTREDIIILKERGILGEDNNIIDVTTFSSTEKLLYALIWKNGDLKKIKHIVNGILADKEERAEEAIVFNQFGRYLSGKQHEPIIDQHVLRAFGVYLYNGNNVAVDRYRRMSIVTRKEEKLIQEYKEWVNTALSHSLRMDPEYVFHVDKVLFGLGRYIKVKD